ncbi:MAG TPA: hypothetical protein VL084_00145 [Thermoanaerobaculia bacterium]|nr:hypothetical protein [Thermoanaerobaculia bacterium]
MTDNPLPAAWNDPAPDPEKRCRHLRTKMMHVTSDWAAHAADYPSASASFWCLRTMSAAGPDDLPAVLGDCHSGRCCFEPPD